MVKPHSQTILFRETRCPFRSPHLVGWAPMEAYQARNKAAVPPSGQWTGSSWVKIVSQPMNILDVTSKVLIFTMFFFWGISKWEKAGSL